MTKPYCAACQPSSVDSRLDSDTRELLEMAHLLGPRDRMALSQIIRRAGEICESDGEETALAVLDQIEGILSGRSSDA